MTEETSPAVEQTLQQILAELRQLNMRENRRDEKAAALEHRFDNLV